MRSIGLLASSEDNDVRALSQRGEMRTTFEETASEAR